ncbi:hypothetical protein IBTHAUMO2_920006 [Nitrosopumilaceae archaeon]|nr:hypothetical protein IBTHAUMO2_920006 [Nitrosopumilaceae archaeon]
MRPGRGKAALTDTMNAAYNEMIRLERAGKSRDCAWEVIRSAREAYEGENLRPGPPTDEQIKDQARIHVKELKGCTEDEIHRRGQDEEGSAGLLGCALLLMDDWLGGPEGGPRSEAARTARDRLYCLCVAVRQEISRMPRKKSYKSQNNIQGLPII